MFAYIGCRTTKHRNARGKGISVYDITPEGWHLLGITPILENPSYLAFDKNKYFLYTVHECIQSGSRWIANFFKYSEQRR